MKASDLLRKQDSFFAKYLDEPLTVYNYVESGVADEYGDTDRTLTSESPISTRGVVSQPTEARSVTRAGGEDVLADARIFLPDSVPLSDGDAENIYASDIERAQSGGVYHVVHIYDENNGRLRVDAVDAENPSPV